ncbi:nuclear transport factor 2 family protein [Actinocorallia longicatena]|uniref:SnoaL-like domain-containing protein n=1 Tax=Actinocorallia longicatena TaxID=111803 RepID=A0ABP6QCD0_9ACTN
MLVSQDPRLVVVRYFEMWNGGDLSIAPEILAEDWLDHAHPEVRGPAAVQEAVAKTRAAQPDLHFEIDALLGGEGQLAVAGTVRVSREAPATRLLWLVTLKDDRMIEMRTYRDTAP